MPGPGVPKSGHEEWAPANHARETTCHLKAAAAGGASWQPGPVLGWWHGAMAVAWTMGFHHSHR